MAIDVEDDQYRDFYAFHPCKRDIAIYTTDGQVYYRRITAAAELSPGVERLTLDANIGVSYTVGEVKMISFLHPSRLDSDSVSMAWDHQEMARISFNTRAVPQ